ncbi:hypothetical protein HMF8227_02349 [Saliniradius amylolyticus]|uniref:Phage tail assembly protein n=1 Tax=Saliniradius amylolyticus TaxID=2183582 RepID=A0A2S2E568_9ALTE|nr:phage tail assembly protein [Saliniradius amylolyticus]AWL12801.1 hypothetical protein HMF8227_02349 [Saliniradius amylolyticus]
MSQKYLPITITLQVPTPLDGKEVEKLTMRPPMAADVFAADQASTSDMERDALLFANLTDTTAEFIKSLSFYDYKRVEQANDLFLLPIPVHLDRRSSLFPAPEEAVSESSNDSPS